MIIGRDAELEELAALVRRSSRQVVTIVGAGGAGKSALALELAQRLSPDFRQGAVFVPLTGLDDPRLLVSEMTRSLGLVDAPGTHPMDRLVWGLRGQHLLLVLDNFEHLVDAANVVGEIAARCSELSVVVTSRRRLNLPTERVVELGGLELPVDGSSNDTPAVRLFVERAGAVDADVQFSDADLATVAALCRLVDGLPLAIELVASHTRTLTLDELWQRLSGGEQLLGLTDTINWSFELLDVAAADLLPRLAVFHEGWTLDAMQAVSGVDDERGFAGLLDAMVELVDLHLVEPRTQADGTMRFALLETVRRFALHELDRSGRTHLVRNAHADHYLTIALAARSSLESPRMAAVSAELDREMPNLRAALTHLATTGRADAGLAMAAALALSWLDRGPIHEGRDWLQRFLVDARPGTTAHAEADAWEARLTFNDALTLPDDWDEGRGTGAVALTDRLRTAHDTLLAAGDLHAAMRAAEHLVYLLGLRGLAGEVEAIVVPLVEAATTPETQWVKADLLRSWASVLRDAGHMAAALEVNDRAILVATEVRNQRVLARAMLTLAIWARDSPAAARAEVEPVYAMSIDTGDLRGAAMASVTVGLLAYWERDMAAAAHWYGITIDLARRIGWGDPMMRGVSGVMIVAQRSGRHVDAARLHGGLRPLDAQFRHRLPPDILHGYHTVVGRIAESLGGRFEAERDAGTAAGWEATVELAMRIASELSSQPPSPPARKRRGPRANTELTERELDVLSQLVAGHTNAQIGDALSISPKTVMHHTMSVYRKLAVRGRAEAVAHAVRAGLVEV